MYLITMQQDAKKQAVVGLGSTSQGFQGQSLRDSETSFHH